VLQTQQIKYRTFIWLILVRILSKTHR